MKLELANETLQEMRRHAEKDYPRECCGFFYGHEGEVRSIGIARPVKNARKNNQRRRFRIDPGDYRKAEKYAADHDLDLLGVYHSHPDHPAEPSEHDRKVAMPWFSYIIISVQDGAAANTRSWRLTDGRVFKEEEIRVKEPKSSNQKNKI